MMRNANLLATLICGLATVLLAMLSPAAAAVLPAAPAAGMEPAADAAPVAFSFTHTAPRGGEAYRAREAAMPARQESWRPRWFGYATANANELPPPAPPGPAMLFAHASLGVAALDAPADAGHDAAALAESGHLSPAQLRLTVPPVRGSGLPSPLPIALIVALVLLPVGMVLGQALRGPPRRPVPAMRRPVAARRAGEE